MQIKDFPNITTLADNDLLLVQTASDDAFKNIKVSDLKACLAGSAGSGSSTSTLQLNYAADGDTKDVFYCIGTSIYTKPWVNPSISSLLITASATEYGDVTLLTNRQDDEFYTSNNANSWVKINLFSSKLICNYYSLRNRNVDLHYLRNWSLQGSNNGSDWVDLDVQTNNSSLNAPSEWLSLPVSSTTPFTQFRLLITGLNSSGYYYICLSEIQVYGAFTP